MKESRITIKIEPTTEDLGLFTDEVNIYTSFEKTTLGRCMRNLGWEIHDTEYAEDEGAMYLIYEKAN